MLIYILIGPFQIVCACMISHLLINVLYSAYVLDLSQTYFDSLNLILYECCAMALIIRQFIPPSHLSRTQLLIPPTHREHDQDY